MAGQRRRRSEDCIIIRGARENNLRNVSLSIPKGELTVFTGVSGSGKSSVVFGTVAVESQRQLNETYSWFIRNRLPKYERPDAAVIKNLSTAIVVDQRPIGGNSRSTVGTMTEVNPALRVLFSRHGEPSAGESSAYSFNDPHGMCPECEGLGRVARLDLDRLLDEGKSLNEGAIRSSLFGVGSFQWKLYAQSGLFDPDKPLRKFSKKDRELLLYGEGFKVERPGKKLTYSNEYEGIVVRFNRRYLKNGLERLKDKEREQVEEVVSAGVCDVCGGARLNEAARKSTIGGKNIADFTAMEIGDLIPVLEDIDAPAAKPVVDAALSVLRRIESVGLGYLSLARETSTLSGGEGQRLKIVRHLGSSLTDLTYIFDEPSVGLHPRDVHRLNELLLALRDKGNTVLVVEHSRDVIAIADHVVDMGPGAGTHGGEVVFEGTAKQLRRADTVTGRRLSRETGLKERVRTPRGKLTTKRTSLHNLKDLSVDIPEGVLTVVTGVAGSGKSSFVHGALVPQFPDAIVIDQAAIGSSYRSTPATYVNIMDTVRKLFAKATHSEPGMFSFNSAGACPACQGRGEIQTDLAYMEPVTTVCERCGGRRYRDEVLDLRFHGKNIAETLALTVEEALEFFTEESVVRRLTTLSDVGLSYITLGQPLSTLSGGELQRIKLADRLDESSGLFVFDEPTTGLHMADVDRLVDLIDTIVDKGNTVVVIEHDLDVVKRADWVIDIGPSAGRDGGRLMFEGTPRQLTRAKDSFTATYLKKDLARAEK
ncbi:excinuclease ABC subunit UvrA [Streptantibioticus parmotrematis]|uniref:excinuclease ABC subunit UvrA n=1 Tax=Streptantibioticus parmotrematis TaxID=2873249 RepID=UPI00340CEB15